MFSYLRQMWRTPELRQRILLTLFLLLVYRLVSHITVPGVDPDQLKLLLDRGSLASGVLGVFAALTGGAVDTFSIVMLGLAPYINASIIIQLCSVIFPKLEELSKEGQQGQVQLNRYTRWLTLPLAFVQSFGYLLLLNGPGGGSGLIDTSFPYVLLPMLYITTGSLFLMWLGELITEKGIGNGTSLIIFAGIVSGIPATISTMFYSSEGKLMAFYLFCMASFAMLVAIVLFTDAHRLIPITYANQGAGRGVQGNIPIRLNQAGMIPIIFAVSLITLPNILGQFMKTSPALTPVSDWINVYINPQNPSILYMVLYFLLVFFFTYFFVSVTFKPNEVAESIQKRGGFVPGLRPGKQTADLLARVSNRLNLFGGLFLGVVAIVPLIFTVYTDLTSQDLIISGSGLIIVVGVVMELIRQVNAQMLAHDYDKLV